MKKLFICLFMTMNMRAMQELALLQAQFLSLVAAQPQGSDTVDEKIMQAYVDELFTAYNALYKKQFEEETEKGEVIPFKGTAADLTELAQKAFKQTKTDVPGWVQESAYRLLHSGEQFTMIFNKHERRCAIGVLEFCFCHPLAVRALLIMKLLREIKLTYPDRNKQLVYTSLGSGGLLQDYLLVQELVAMGYRNLVINVIDPSYPQFLQVPQTDADMVQEYKALFEKNEAITERNKKVEEEAKKKNEQNFNLESLTPAEYDRMNFLEYVATLHHFERKLELWRSKKHIDIQFTIYDDAYVYMHRVEKNSAPKSDVLIMVDAGGGSVGHFITKANMVTAGSELKILLPHQGDMRIYRKKDMTNVPDEVIKQYDDLLGRLRACKKGGKRSKQALLELIDKFVVDHMPEYHKKFAAENYDNLTQQLQDIQKKRDLDPDDFKRMALLSEKLEKLSEYSFSFDWQAEAAIAFWDMIHTVVHKNSIIYEIEKRKNQEGEFCVSQDDIQKVDPDIYKKKELIDLKWDGKDYERVI